MKNSETPTPDICVCDTSTDGRILFLCTMLGIPKFSSSVKINIFIENNISSYSSLTMHFNALNDSLLKRIKSLGTPFFALTNKEQADVVFRISTKHVKIHKRRHRIISGEWIETEQAKELLRSGREKNSWEKKSILNFKPKPRIEKTITGEFDYLAEEFMNQPGFIKECAFIIAYKSLAA